MSISNNSKKIKSIYCNGKEIKEVRVNNKLVYEKIDPTYNYFVFNTHIGVITGGSTTSKPKTYITLQEYRAGDTTYWDGLTDWGDGTIDNKSYHEYAYDGIYTVKTKWTIRNQSGSGVYNTSTTLIKCLNINNNITNMSHMFYACGNLEHVDLSRCNNGKITDMSYLFYSCTALTKLKIKNLNTSNVTDMSYMFYNCTELNLQLSSLDTSSVRNMSYMFYSCGSFFGSDAVHFDGSQFKNWNISNVTNTSYMFYNSSITGTLDLSGWNVLNVADMSYMFYYCTIRNSTNLDIYDKIDISNWDINNTVTLNGVFSYVNEYCCNDVEHHVIHTGVSAADWYRLTEQ